MASAAFEEIAETFEFLDDWEDRYRHVIELGKAMPALEEAFRVPATKVEGCASQVWLLPRIEGRGAAARFDFQGDSDAMIVRGLIAILHALFSGLSAAEAARVDAAAELAQDLVAGDVDRGGHARFFHWRQACRPRARSLAEKPSAARRGGHRSGPMGSAGADPSTTLTDRFRHNAATGKALRGPEF